MPVTTRLKSLVASSGLEPGLLWTYTRLHPGGKDDRLALRVMRRALQHDSNCIDVGAHRGAMLAEMRRLSPAGRHVAVEPLPAFADRLRKRYPDVNVISSALSDRDGQTSFQHVESNPAYSGILRREYPAAEHVNEINVPLRTLDSIVPPNHPVRLIKIDVEGGEAAVLRGGSRVIAANRPLILFEHERGAADRYESGPSEVWEIVVQQFALNISTMPRWLVGAPPLSESDFRDHFDRRVSSYFLAY